MTYRDDRLGEAHYHFEIETWREPVLVEVVSVRPADRSAEIRSNTATTVRVSLNTLTPATGDDNFALLYEELMP